MLTSHELLLKYYHDRRFDFPAITVCYVDRGAPGDESCVSGDRINRLGPYCFEIASPPAGTEIPYHRILRILYEGELMWDRTVRTRKKGTVDRPE